MPHLEFYRHQQYYPNGWCGFSAPPIFTFNGFKSLSTKVMASGPETRITAMAPVPEGVAKATMLSVYDMGTKVQIS